MSQNTGAMPRQGNSSAVESSDGSRQRTHCRASMMLPAETPKNGVPSACSPRRNSTIPVSSRTRMPSSTSPPLTNTTSALLEHLARLLRDSLACRTAAPASRPPRPPSGTSARSKRGTPRCPPRLPRCRQTGGAAACCPIVPSPRAARISGSGPLRRPSPSHPRSSDRIRRLSAMATPVILFPHSEAWSGSGKPPPHEEELARCLGSDGRDLLHCHLDAGAEKLPESRRRSRPARARPRPSSPTKER